MAAHDGHGGFFLLADHEDVGAALAAEGDGGGLLDGDRFAEPGERRVRAGGGQVRALEQGDEPLILADVGGGVAFEDDRAWVRRRRFSARLRGRCSR